MTVQAKSQQTVKIERQSSGSQNQLYEERLQGALEMAGGICHELNQPLQVASGSSELLLMNLSRSNPLYETISKIKEQIDRMGDITRKLAGITTYHTKDYIQGTTIFDIDKAST